MEYHWLQMKSGQLIGLLAAIQSVIYAWHLIQRNYDHFHGLGIKISQIA